MRHAARAGEPAHDCFQDEIAIDFPSISSLVNRVRDAFLGDAEREASGTVMRELRLSNREARRGTIIPIELPIRGTCRQCGGRGEVWTEPCLECCGSGDSLVRNIPWGVGAGRCPRRRALPLPRVLSARRAGSRRLRVAICA